MSKCLHVLLCAFITCLCSQSYAQQVIQTIAGTGMTGYSGDGGMATDAQFGENVVYAVVDVSGNIYITDQDNHCIRKVTPAGVISTIAGVGTAGYSGDGGPATAAKLKYPYGIAIDPSGNIYIADGLNYVVRKINTAGIISTFAGTGVVGFSGDGGPAIAAKTNLVTGVKCDALGNVYIADHGNHRIRKINTSGIISTYAGNGAATFSGDGGQATAAALWQPHDLAFDALGNLYIADANNHRIRKVTTSGIISTVAGTGVAGYSGDGGPATSAALSFYYGIAIDPAGNIIINDAYNSRIRKINTAGVISTIAGTGVWGYGGDGCSPLLAEVSGWSISTDAIGNIYIPDNRTRVIHMGYSPYFINGNTQSLNVCKNSVNDISPALIVADQDQLQTETWSMVMPPAHGALVAAYTTISTGGLLIPASATYAPTVGYIGVDSFRVKITDCVGATNFTTVYIAVETNPSTGNVTAPASVCPGLTAVYSSTVPGGAWSSSDAAVATISAVGVVEGVLPGTCTISYTAVNSCGTTTVTFPFTVLPFFGCTTDVNGSMSKEAGLTVYPNPVNDAQFTVYISSDRNEDAQISILNLLGEKVKELVVKTNTSISVTTDFPSGIYLLTATTSHYTFSTRLQH